MKERPILFGGPMVRAIIEGRKTQTRRIVKHPDGGLASPREDATWRMASDGLWHPCVDMLGRGVMDPLGSGVRCPYGQPGDRLWVKETLKRDGTGIAYAADGARPQVRPLRDGECRWGWKTSEGWRWKANSLPSIHMPRWASRLTLEITEVRVERLQDISEEDAKAEGAEITNGHPELGAVIGAGPSHREGFAQLWRSINADRASWASNPFVWVVAFRVAEVRR